MKIDNYYKFVGSTFGFAYFIGIVVGVIYSVLGIIVIEQVDFSQLFFLSSTIQFRSVFLNFFYNAIQFMLVPFLYLIESVKYGFLHASMLVSPFLGQIKLLVQLFPQIFYFITFIIFSTIGLKLMLFIIKSLANLFFNIQHKKTKLKIDFFNKQDILLLYVALVSLAIGVFIQLFLSRIFFIFLINFQLITYIFIILIYVILVSLSLYLAYKTTLSLLDSFDKISKKFM